jgi:hypothetical protein
MREVTVTIPKEVAYRLYENAKAELDAGVGPKKELREVSQRLAKAIGYYGGRSVPVTLDSEEQVTVLESLAPGIEIFDREMETGFPVNTTKAMGWRHPGEPPDEIAEKFRRK